MIIYAVDDERPALTLLKSAILKAIPDADLTTFGRAVDLLEAAKEKTPDVVFLDIEMPTMNGLELASKLNEVDRAIKIIFVTGYGQYAREAFDVYASGYIMKPCKAEQIEKVMQKIIPTATQKDVVVKTFGNFDVAYKGTSVRFGLAKSKEMLAYLVDRLGALVTRPEMAGILFEDDYSRNTQSHLSHIASGLASDLENAGIHGFFQKENGYSLDMSVADCDLLDFLDGKTSLYVGEYMTQYSWADLRRDDFERLKNK